VRNEGRRDVRHDLPGDGLGTIEALLTGGGPRSLRNAGIVIDAASRQPERLEELVQCVFSADEIVRMRASDALERSADLRRPRSSETPASIRRTPRCYLRLSSRSHRRKSAASRACSGSGRPTQNRRSQA
jgi:hypothetical protein